MKNSQINKRSKKFKIKLIGGNQ